MKSVSKKLYKEQIKLTKWFAIITGICLLLLVASYFWLHSMLVLVIGAMFGPIFLLLTLVFAGLALATKAKLGQ